MRGAITVRRHTECDATDLPRAPVAHEFAVVAYYVGGRSRVEQGLALDVVEGDVLLVPPGTIHRTLEKHRPEYWGLGVHLSSLAARDGAAWLQPFERVRDGATPVVRIPADRREYLERLFQELERESLDPRAPRDALEAIQRSLLLLILNEVARASGTHEIPPSRSSLVTDTLRYIERHCLRHLTLREVAASVGRSPAHVTTVLKKATGLSAGEWIVSGRMSEARRLLLLSDEKIDVIAERVGYADATHFIRMFRRAHGATPAAWRSSRN